MVGALVWLKGLLLRLPVSELPIECRLANAEHAGCLLLVAVGVINGSQDGAFLKLSDWNNACVSLRNTV